MNQEQTLGRLSGEIPVEMTTTIRRSFFYFISERYVITTRAKTGGKTFTETDVCQSTETAKSYSRSQPKVLMERIQKYFTNGLYRTPVVIQSKDKVVLP